MLSVYATFLRLGFCQYIVTLQVWYELELGGFFKKKKNIQGDVVVCDKDNPEMPSRKLGKNGESRFAFLFSDTK